MGWLLLLISLFLVLQTLLNFGHMVRPATAKHLFSALFPQLNAENRTPLCRSRSCSRSRCPFVAHTIPAVVHLPSTHFN